MKKSLFPLITLLFLSPNLFAQQHLECGVDPIEGAAIKQRMFDNRLTIRAQDIQAIQASRSITWIPVTIRIVGDASGNGYINELSVYAMFCDLNNDYASQNIQYYLHSPIAYLNNQAIYENAKSNTAKQTMRNNKVANTINIYVSPSVNNPGGSFYAGGSNDFISMLTSQTNGSTSTCSHEVGHFFTLSHTFYGWENNDYQALYSGGPAPTTIGNNKTVEYAARTGPLSNCNSAADGFCDTHPDYYSTRENCPYSSTGLIAKDPTGATVYPSDSNVMSYFVYGCRRSFSGDQRNAVLADVIARGWSSFAPPASTASNLDGASFAPISPAAGQTIAATAGFINFSWAPIAGATSYYLEIVNTIAGTIPLPNSPKLKITVSNATSYNLLASALNFNMTYAWRIKPINDYYTCANMSPYYLFTFGQLTSVQNLTDKKVPIEMNVFPNPIQNAKQITVEIAAAMAGEGNFKLRAIDGRLLETYPLSVIQQGNNKFILDISSLGTGTYLISLSTKDTVLHKKFLIL